MVSYMTPQGQTYMVPSPTPVSSVPRGHFSDFVRRVEVSRLRPTPHAHGAHVRITGTHIHTCARGHPVHVCAHTHTHTHTQACTHTWRAPACIVPEGLLFELFAAQQGQRLISHLLLLHEHMQVHARTHAHTHTHIHTGTPPASKHFPGTCILRVSMCMRFQRGQWSLLLSPAQGSWPCVHHRG